jgi:hypothetical protein
MEAGPSAITPASAITAASPTVFHITHWKAGSQWIHRILIGCVSDRIVPPHHEMAQVLENAIQPGGVYPTVYLPYEEFSRITVPPDSRRFVVIRDLRDTLVSHYFSLKLSHEVIAPWMSDVRARLESMNTEDGLIHVMDVFLPLCGDIQESWLAAGEPLIRYEELLERDLVILTRVLLDECGLPVDHEQLREVVLANRFSRVTGGRLPGQEDRRAHERKGVAGDWRDHFTKRVKNAFKDRFGELLFTTGYEKDLGW